MKTSEFVEGIEGLGYKADIDVFYIYIMDEHGEYVASISTRYMYVLDTNNEYNTFYSDEEVFELMYEYVKTPIKEREADKLFIVRVPNTETWYYYINERRGKGVQLGRWREEDDVMEREGYHFTEDEVSELLPDVPAKYVKEVAE